MNNAHIETSVPTDDGELLYPEFTRNFAKSIFEKRDAGVYKNTYLESRPICELVAHELGAYNAVLRPPYNNIIFATPEDKLLFVMMWR